MALVNKTVFNVNKNILIADDSYKVTLPALVKNDNVSAGSDGRKIIKAGTPLKGDLKTRDTAFEIAQTKSEATCIALHDVDVTDGNNNATILIAGCVDLLKLDSDVQGMIDTDAETALSRIIFVKGSAI